MTIKLLLVCAERDIELEICEIVDAWSTAGGHDVDVRREECFDDAFRALSQGMSDGVPIDLVVTMLEIPRTRKSPKRRDDHLAFRLLKESRDAGVEAYCFVITEMPTWRFRKAASDDIGGCDLINGKTLESDLTDALEWFALASAGPGPSMSADGGASPTRRAPSTDPATIEINLQSDPGTYSIRNPGVFDAPTDILNLDRDTMRRVREANDSLGSPNDPKWLLELKRLGELLHQGLFSDVYFRDEFLLALDQTQLEGARLRFLVAEHNYNLALESLYNHRWQWWMLQAPITRRLPPEGWKSPLFFDKETTGQPVNCLVIEADAEGWHEKTGELPRLANVGLECESLIGLLDPDNAQDRTVEIGSVRRIPDPSCGLAGATSFGDRVRQALTGEGASDSHEVSHLVHFAGHSFYDDEGKQGYLVFPGGREGELELLDIETFAEWLRAADTRFVYLSSCESSAEKIVFELAQHRVPAIVGFRWDVDDQLAAQHASAFYTHLLCEHSSLEKAFLMARKKMHEEDKRQYANKPKRDVRTAPIWTAPVMILQTSA